MNNGNSKNILTWKQTEKHTDTWESTFWPKAGCPFHFKVSLSGVTSNPWYTVIIHKGDHLICRQDEESFEKAKDACESFLKHMHYREGVSRYEIYHDNIRKA